MDETTMLFLSEHILPVIYTAGAFVFALVVIIAVCVALIKVLS